jgi:hypothetical protein
MKALIIYCFAILLLASAYPSYAADPPLTIANFSVERGLPFSLLLDGQPVTQPTAPQLHLDYLTPGQHAVELRLGSTLRGRGGPRIRAAVWLEEGLETSFILTQRPGAGWQLRQVSTTALPGYGYEDQPGTYSQPAPTAPAYADAPTGSPTGPSYPPVAAPAYPPALGYSAPVPTYPAPFSSPDVADLVQALKQCSFDDKRLPIFYQAMSRAYVRADDLAAMVRTMTYSDSQQQVATFGYAHLNDPQNFQHVLAALTFSTDASSVLDKLGLKRF